jgi:glycosyltransferase involved in cell wall biosynthesis
MATYSPDTAASPFFREYAKLILNYTETGSRTCSAFSSDVHDAIWLSLRGIESSVHLESPQGLEQVRQLAESCEAKIALASSSLLQFFEAERPRYQVVHHVDAIHRFTPPQIRAMLAQQVGSANFVVFSVPSVYAEPTGEGREYLLSLEQWREILSPFQIEELRYGAVSPGQQDEACANDIGHSEQILVVLRGQEVDEALLSLMSVPEKPYPQGISAIVHTRNESRHIEACLQTLIGWVDEIIVCDMESSDDTLAIASRYTDNFIHHSLIPNFDQARNVSAKRAKYGWIFYLDADERVPAETGRQLRAIVMNGEPDFEALAMPFRHIFSGRWLRHIYPGYKSPQLFKNGKFTYNTQLHSGTRVEGRVALFPADNPDLALLHYSQDSIAHYLDKLNSYTDGEALNLWEADRPFDWRVMMRDFVRDAQLHYDIKNAPLDEGYGLTYALLSGFYRLISHAKLYERRDHEGKLTPGERQVPPRLEDVLEYALQLLRQPPQPTLRPLDIVSSGSKGADLVWSGPLLSPSGFGEQSRNHFFGLAEAGISFAAQILPWGNASAELEDAERETLARLENVSVVPGFTHIVHDVAGHLSRHPQAGLCIGRTIFETDRLPVNWVKACNQMDEVWVCGEFNRRTFTDAGVAADKIRVFPDSIDPSEFEGLAASPLIEELRPKGEYVFLSVFDWTLHKGWDLLLEGFLRAFEGRNDVVLVLKVWSSMGLSLEELRQQAAEHIKQKLGLDLLADGRIHFMQQQLSHRAHLQLFQAADAYVLPSRAEGWGRPYMEAMACGKPTIATGWGGNTDFMTSENSYLLDYELTAVPEAGWREIPVYKGHRWAEPSLPHLIETLREVESDRSGAKKKAKQGQDDVYRTLNRVTVAQKMVQAVKELRERQGNILENADSPPGSEQVTEAPSAEPASAVPTTGKAAVSTTRVRWEGGQFVWHSFGHINRELSLALLDTKQVDLSLEVTENPQFSAGEDPRFAALERRFFAPLNGEAQVHVRHSYPPRLDPPPSQGHFVLIQPWEFGYLPTAWIEPIQRNVQEVWCVSSYVRDTFASSGIAEEKLHMLPLGANTAVLNPQALPHVFTDEAGAKVFSKGKGDRFVFLFLGGTLSRKGIDILLAAYQRAFSAYDEVCLVIKDTGTKTLYRHGNAQDEILRLVDDASRPPIIYLDADLSDRQIAGIYTASDCYVHPYRGEGFCMPVLEAMACGLPVIVPQGGATDDFVDEVVGWRVAAEKQLVGVGPSGRGRVGEFDCVGPTWMLEVDIDVLARQMREVYQNRDESKKRGENAVLRVQNGWTWNHSAQAVLSRLEVLRGIEPRAISPSPLGKGLNIGADRGNGAVQAGDSVSEAPEPTESTISLCMIVKNEERVLGDCLASAKLWFDEMIVVDTGSTDRTVEIAKEHGARVFHFPWCDDFSAARNESLRHATSEWVFWMDADDTLPAESGRKLRELAAMAQESTTGFIVQVQIPPPSGETGYTIVDHLKLFRNRPELRFEGRIHEQILEPINRIDGRVERSDAYVVHSGYDYSPEGQKHKRERDLQILEKDLADRPNHPFVLFNIGMTAYHMKDFAKAEEALQHCLAVSKPRESTLRKVYAMLAGSRLEQRDLPGARHWIEQGLSRYPRDPELLFRGGIVYRELGDLDRAEQCFLTLLTAREVGHIDSLDVTMTGYKAHHNLAVVYQDKGDLPKAEQQFRQSVNLEPHFAPSWHGLASIYHQAERWDDLRQVQLKLGHPENFA